MEATNLKETIIKKYGSINAFIEQVDTTLSRATLYRLLNNQGENPTKNTIKELARITGFSCEEVLNEFDGNGYRDERTRD